MLDNLSPMSKLNLSNFRLEGDFINISNLINETIEVYKPQLDSQELKIKVDSDNDKPIRANKSVISFILQNLLSNAIKYSNYGGIVNIDFIVSNRNLELSIRDSGVGISEEKISEIMSNTNKFNFENLDFQDESGLGLNLCQQFLNQNNGRLEIESELGLGTKITAKIPLSF